jgi:SsrA-binding protein
MKDAEKQIKTGVFAENRRASFDYEILETFEAGLALLGSEVKSVQNSRATISGAQVLFRGGIAYLVGADIQAYQPNNNTEAYDPLRVRPLLLKKSEIEHIFRISTEQKLTLPALKLYNKGSRIKLLFGIARRRKKSDKREVLKKKADVREMRQDRR